MAEITTNLTEYAGVVPNRTTQEQYEFDDASTALQDYWGVLAPELNAWSDEVNAVGAEAVSMAASAQAARDLAQTYRDQAQAYSGQSALYESGAQTAAANAESAQAAAEAAEIAAQGYASLAQATNPDTPIRVNPNAISADFTLAAGYNGSSIGPISIIEGVNVAIPAHSRWSIV